MNYFVTPLLQRLSEVTDFNYMYDWMLSSYWLPVGLGIFYLSFVHGGRRIVKTPYNFNTFNTWWNVGLVVFSFVGAYHCWPRLIELLMAKEVSDINPNTENYIYKSYANKLSDPSTWSPAFKRNVFKKPDGSYALQGSWDTATCVFHEDAYRRNAIGYINLLFVFSKIPELVDTFLLVLQRKKIIFLHWYHHTSVLLYCWQAWTSPNATLLWFSTINMTVHTVMYTYYFLACIGIRPGKIAPFITGSQIIQMIIGFIANAYALYHDKYSGKGCDTNLTHNYLFMIMYVSYGVLFSNFFIRRYIMTPPPRTASGSKKVD
eukprot:gene8956-6283_t